MTHLNFENMNYSDNQFRLVYQNLGGRIKDVFSRKEEKDTPAPQINNSDILQQLENQSLEASKKQLEQLPQTKLEEIDAETQSRLDALTLLEKQNKSYFGDQSERLNQALEKMKKIIDESAVSLAGNIISEKNIPTQINIKALDPALLLATIDAILSIPRFAPNFSIPSNINSDEEAKLFIDQSEKSMIENHPGLADAATATYRELYWAAESLGSNHYALGDQSEDSKPIKNLLDVVTIYNKLNGRDIE